MAARLRFWSRIAFGSALFFVGCASAIFNFEMGLWWGPQDKQRSMEFLFDVCAILAILAGFLAFILDLACWLKGACKVPWIMIAISALGVCCVVFSILIAFGLDGLLNRFFSEIVPEFRRGHSCLIASLARQDLSPRDSMEVAHEQN